MKGRRGQEEVEGWQTEARDGERVTDEVSRRTQKNIMKRLSCNIH